MPPAGSSPGTLAAPAEAAPTVLSVTAYNARAVVEKTGVGIDDIAALRTDGNIVWVDCTGFRDMAPIRALGDMFALHRLALADVVNLQQRAKYEDYGEHAFLLLRMIDAENPTETEQLGLFLGPDFVLTFQERAGDNFRLVRNRLLDAQGQMRKRGGDYLAYALIDAAVDGYFPVLESIDDRLGELEGAILSAQQRTPAIADLHATRRCLLDLRRAAWPLREVASALVRGESPHFSGDVRPYLRDVHDHVVQLLDLLENYRELSSSLLDLHLSLVNHRLNEVMKVLTIIATIFIPLTFIVGVYGMNFECMPETKQWWGYPAVLLLMVTIAAVMLRWFRRRGWL